MSQSTNVIESSSKPESFDSFRPKKRKKKVSNIENLKKEMKLDEHKISVYELCERYKTDKNNGLDEEIAKQKLASDGPNALTPPPTIPEWVRLLENMFCLFNSLLWIASLLCLICYLAEINSLEYPRKDNLYLSIALAVVVSISGFFSYYQQSKSEDIMSSFKNMSPKTATVIRNGKKMIIPVEDLVVGDLVDVRGGDQVPADLRIIKAQGMKVDNSSLTGESEPLSRGANCTNDDPLMTKNLAFFSTNCVEGAGKGIVIRVGDRTSIGRIANLTSGIEANPTPLSRDIYRFISGITYVSVFIGLLFGFISLFLGFTWLQSSILVISLIVGQVPEGLLPTLTVVLTLTAKRMVKKNCLLKNLEAVETLGSTSTICTDKTGTLTQNKMTVSHVWCDNEIVDAKSLLSQGQQKISINSPTWESLIRVASLCSRAQFSANQSDKDIPKRQAIGDASEVAILRYMEALTHSVADYRRRYPKVYEIPFNSTNKYSLTISQSMIDKGHWLSMKGAPERIIERCSTIFIGGREVPFTQNFRDQFHRAYETLGSLGERVIGLCERHLPEEQFPNDYPFNEDEDNFPIRDFRFIGLISMIDPPRASVPDAIAKCRRAGIKVIMVTGDHPITAKAIARAVGIISEGNQTLEEVASAMRVPVNAIDPAQIQAIVISGSELKDYSKKDLDYVLKNYNEIVFARTSPQQKLIIVEGCQRAGQIVAVTGDGVNDSPALKKADIGVAMGITGSDVSKQAADMVLLDDNFSTILTGIEEGRVIFDNLKKSICYTLSSKMPELIPFLLYFALGIPLPLGPIYILFIDFGTDMIPAISVGYETAETDILKRKPRNPKKDRLVTEKVISISYGQLGIIEAMAGFFTWAVAMAHMGFDPAMLIGVRSRWDSKSINDFEDSYGQEWTYTQRKTLEYQTNTAFFATIVLTKWAALIVCKSRKISILKKGMNNHVMNISMLLELGLVLFLTYTPGMEKGLNMYRLELIWWILPIPFMILIIGIFEFEKYAIRNDSWAEKEFLY